MLRTITASPARMDTVMPDMAEALGQDVSQEAPDKRVRWQRHDLLPLGTLAAIICEPKGDTSFVERYQLPTRGNQAAGESLPLQCHAVEEA